MRTTRIAVACFALLPALCVSAQETKKVNSRGVYAYYDADQALAMAKATGKPMLVLCIRGNDCAGGL
jgi:hypothetical protein